MAEQKISSYLKLLFLLIGKNIKLLTRSKISTSIILLGPILLVVLLGFSFSSSELYGITIGIHSVGDTESQDVQSFINELKENEFDVTRFDSINRCQEDLKTGSIHLCIDLPPTLNINDNIQKQITFYADYSRVNLAFLVLEVVNKKVEEQASTLSLNATENLIGKISETSVALKKHISSLDDPISLVDQTTKNINKATSDLEDIDTDHEDITEQIDDIYTDFDYIIENYTVQDKDSRDIYENLQTIDDRFKNITKAFVDIENSKVGLDQQLDSSSQLAAKTKNDLEELKETLNTLAALLEDNPISDVGTIVNPLTTDIVTVSTNQSNLDYLSPLMIVLIIMFMTIFLSSTLVVTGHSSKASFRTMVSLKGETINFLATYLTVFFIVTLQILFFIGVSEFFWNINITENFFLIVFILLLLITLFTFIGIALGYLPQKHETAILAAISLNSIFLLFSDLIFPLESMPPFMKSAASFNPFVLGTASLNKVLLLGVIATEQLITLTLYAVFALFLIYFAHKIRDIRLNK